MENLEIKGACKRSSEHKETKEYLQEEWLKLSASTCKKLVSSYGKGLEAVKQNKGYATKY